MIDGLLVEQYPTPRLNVDDNVSRIHHLFQYCLNSFPILFLFGFFSPIAVLHVTKIAHLLYSLLLLLVRASTLVELEIN